MQSCIYEGFVRHRRFRPVANQFAYSIFLMYLDLDELDQVFAGRWLWSTSRFALARFRRSDHFGDESVPLAGCVKDTVEENTGDRPTGAVRLLTHLRYFGYQMNPVSFFYCFNSDDRLHSVVAEVNNTPWGERHLYVLHSPLQNSGAAQKIWQDKQFHVSPFMQMEMKYRWLLSEPSERLAVSIQNHPTGGLATEEGADRATLAGDRPFDVVMSLKRKPINSLNLNSVLLRYPLMTAKVTAAIYWQATRLWWKGCPFVPHPKKTKAGNLQPTS